VDVFESFEADCAAASPVGRALRPNTQAGDQRANTASVTASQGRPPPTPASQPDGEWRPGWVRKQKRSIRLAAVGGIPADQKVADAGLDELAQRVTDEPPEPTPVVMPSPRDVVKDVTDVDVADALRAAYGNVREAAILLGYGSASVRKRIKGSPMLTALLADIEQDNLDEVEGRMWRAAKLGCTKSAGVVLKAKGKERGYGTITDDGGAGGQAPPVNIGEQVAQVLAGLAAALGARGAVEAHLSDRARVVEEAVVVPGEAEPATAGRELEHVGLRGGAREREDQDRSGVDQLDSGGQSWMAPGPDWGDGG
jgi:hypothetical protein